MWLVESKGRLEKRLRIRREPGQLSPQEFPCQGFTVGLEGSHQLLGLCFALLRSQIPRAEFDWTSLGHMVAPWPDKARHLTDSSTYGEEAILEAEIRVLY